MKVSFGKLISNYAKRSSSNNFPYTLRSSSKSLELNNKGSLFLLLPIREISHQNDSSLSSPSSSSSSATTTATATTTTTNSTSNYLK